MEVTAKIEGLADLERNLRTLPEALAKKVLVKAARAGGNLLRRAALASAQAKFQPHTWRLFRGIRTAFRIRGLGVKGALVQYFIGLSKKGKDSPFYGRFLEMGWRAIGRGKGRRLRLRRGTLRGRDVPPKPWMAPAWEATKQAALAKFVEVARTEFQKLKT